MSADLKFIPLAHSVFSCQRF